jgi:ER lumen protein retaining receptor
LLTRVIGVSLITQALYALVFCTRYLDIFTSSATADGWHTWNFTLKVCICLCHCCLNDANYHQIFYTLSSLYIIFLMTSVYARTREREKAWKFGLYCLAGAIVVAPFWYLIFKKWIIRHNTFMGVCMPSPNTREVTDAYSCYGSFLRYSNPSA